MEDDYRFEQLFTELLEQYKFFFIVSDDITPEIQQKAKAKIEEIINQYVVENW